MAEQPDQITDECGCNQPGAVHQRGDEGFCRAAVDPITETQGKIDRLRAELNRLRATTPTSQPPPPEWFGKIRQLLSDVALAAGYTATDLEGLPAHVATLAWSSATPDGPAAPDTASRQMAVKEPSPQVEAGVAPENAPGIGQAVKNAGAVPDTGQAREPVSAAEPIVAAVDLLFQHRHTLPPDVLRSMAGIWVCASAARYGEPYERFWEDDPFADHDTDECEAENATPSCMQPDYCIGEPAGDTTTEESGR